MLVRKPSARPRGARGPREGAVRHLLLQLLDVPVGARRVGGRSAVPDLPIHRLNEEPTRRATLADITCDSTARSTVHRPARRQARARAAPVERRRPTTSASSWSAPTRRSSATSTTCSATPTPCTSAAEAARLRRQGRGRGRHRERGAAVRRLLADDLLGRMRNTVEKALRKKLHDDRGVAPPPAHLRGRPVRLHLPRIAK